MTLLPVVARELRVAARKWGTYWSRVIAAGVALVIFSGIVLISELAQGAGRGQLGAYLFQAFSWISFACVCAGGVFLTSDSLSEEKREGTLGLLFLTDLRGFDVVLGKLMASSLRGAYGLVAAFPIVGMSFLLGGLTGQEFWRLLLLLCNTLFFTLAVGMFISAISREGQRAMFATAGICFAFLGMTWLVDWALASWEPANFIQRFSLASPVNGMLQLRAGRFGTFWTTMGIVHAAGWIFLIAACVAAPRSWQDKAARTGSSGRRQWLRGTPEKQAAWRRRLFEVNPVQWLAARGSWLASVWGVISLLALILVAYGAFSADTNTRNVLQGLAQLAGWLLSFLLILSLASYSSRFFVEATHCGALELILASPLPPQEIVRGQWWALRRAFLVPACVVLAVKLITSVVQLIQVWKMTKVSTAAQGGPVAAMFSNEYFIAQVIGINQSILSFFTGLLAVAWFGMWMGVTTRKANAAVAKTLLFVCVLPWFVLIFLQGILYSLAGLFGTRLGVGQFPFWLPPLIGSALGIGVDLMFLFMARRKLLGNFRETVARAAGIANFHRLTPPESKPAPPHLPPSA